TTRVYNRRSWPSELQLTSRAVAPVEPGRGFWRAVVAALIVVPIAGAAEPASGWTGASLTAAGVLLLQRARRGWAPWGLLLLVIGLVAVLVPRDAFSWSGSALFVGATLCAVLWHANRGAATTRDTRPRPGSPERQAQLQMGYEGEEYVSSV